MLTGDTEKFKKRMEKEGKLAVAKKAGVLVKAEARIEALEKENAELAEEAKSCKDRIAALEKERTELEKKLAEAAKKK